ncbi:MAG: IS21 family transposase [Enorma sp.]|uniref:IS21 family transposase n=1 Tax=Enorma sp. TaxID=1920692 RepID=UPI00258E9D93|nr:IS21 family transposase [Enorma sp.]MCI7774494.1 IS21 family transposase [Enorma sp.]
MERNAMGELNMYRQLGIKPNFTEIGRRYGLHRQTVAKYWRRGEEIEDRRSDRASAFDEFRDVIERKSALPGITKRAIHEFLLDRHPDAGLPKYGAFTKYCRERGIECPAPASREPHPRFETPPGRQLQFDWKEGLRMVDANGEAFEFSVFTATLGYSRAHRFIYSRTRTEDDLLACLLATFVRFGGVPEEAVTDNMGALVSFVDGRRVRSARAARFAREAGFELKLCRPRTPETKGKDESANRFVSRLLAYDRDFEGERGLAEAIARIEARSNSEPSEATGLPPAVLFMREKEHLRPIGNLRLLQEMVGEVSVQRVPATMLVRAAGRQWSVPRSCIGKKVSVTTMPSGQIRVALDGETVAVHDASAASGPVNYAEDHYVEALSRKAWFGDADIRDAARANLELLDRLGGE